MEISGPRYCMVVKGQQWTSAGNAFCGADGASAPECDFPCYAEGLLWRGIPALALAFLLPILLLFVWCFRKSCRFRHRREGQQRLRLAVIVAGAVTASSVLPALIGNQILSSALPGFANLLLSLSRTLGGDDLAILVDAASSQLGGQFRQVDAQIQSVRSILEEAAQIIFQVNGDRERVLFGGILTTCLLGAFLAVGACTRLQWSPTVGFLLGPLVLLFGLGVFFVHYPVLLVDYDVSVVLDASLRLPQGLSPILDSLMPCNELRAQVRPVLDSAASMGITSGRLVDILREFERCEPHRAFLASARPLMVETGTAMTYLLAGSALSSFALFTTIAFSICMKAHGGLKGEPPSAGRPANSTEIGAIAVPTGHQADDFSILVSPRGGEDDEDDFDDRGDWDRSSPPASSRPRVAAGDQEVPSERLMVSTRDLDDERFVAENAQFDVGNASEPDDDEDDGFNRQRKDEVGANDDDDDDDDDLGAPPPPPPMDDDDDEL